MRSLRSWTGMATLFCMLIAPTAMGGQESESERAGRRRLGAWVVAGASGVATVQLFRGALEHWESGRIYDARAQDPARSFTERTQLHDQAINEWEKGNKSRNLALASAAATVTVTALLLRLYGEEVPGPGELALEPLPSGAALRWSLNF